MSENKLATKSDLQEMYNRIYPYLGGMPEMVANKFSKGDLYSTDEKMIGQWIDGKPAYQKTFTCVISVSSSTDTTVVLDSYIDDIDLVIDTPWVSFIGIDGQQKGIKEQRYLTASSGERRLLFKYSAASENVTATITVKYTKTTDSAISIGEATDYSTEEKIVGTWIDGKPVYQKTIQGVMPTVSASATASTNYAIGANVDTVVDANGVFKSTSEHWTQRLTTLNDTFSNGAKLTVYDNSADSTHKNKVYISSNVVGWNGFTCYITIQYTKKTT